MRKKELYGGKIRKALFSAFASIVPFGKYDLALIFS